MDRSCRSSTVGSEAFKHGSSSRARPRFDSLPSGRGTLMKPSTSPTAGTKSGTKGLSCVSRSTVCGLYRVIYPKSSLTSLFTFKFAYSFGSYCPGVAFAPALSGSLSSLLVDDEESLASLRASVCTCGCAVPPTVDDGDSAGLILPDALGSGCGAPSVPASDPGPVG